MVRRLYVEKKDEFAVEAKAVFNDIKTALQVMSVLKVRVINRYDVEGINDEDFDKAVETVFSDPPVDFVFEELPEAKVMEQIFAVQYLPGQFDQRADSCAQCIQLMTGKERPVVKTAKIYILSGYIDEDELSLIKNYLINPVESYETDDEPLETLNEDVSAPVGVKTIDGFISYDKDALEEMLYEYALSMDYGDLKFTQEYFQKERRDPTITEIRVLDTYWSDHCRHTTFLTKLENISISENLPYIKQAYNEYLKLREEIYAEGARAGKPVTLMDLATIGAKKLKKDGKIPDLDESDEINACSIKITAEVGGRPEEWVVMFKNETHNHPTEIEPFGGAATCLGGAIRDPLSGRSYVYQAMRVTGAANPLQPIDETLEGKLPQRKITVTAAEGYSSYGNQIGLATGLVQEYYHPGYAAKRLEIGAVVGAAPYKNIRRETPAKGDVVVLLGGKTGRDGCGGATGSSKAHNADSVMTCGAEVQKGNAPEERKLQRLFRNPEVTAMIKRCNDFGAGGVSVAIGELADGLKIDLDKVPKKYDGLDGTEIAISESQERMAVVVAPGDVEKFVAEACKENLEATPVAEVTEQPNLVMTWNGDVIVDISRDFLNSNGAAKTAEVTVDYKTPEIEPIERDCPSIANTSKKSGVEDNFTFSSCYDLGGAGDLTDPFENSLNSAFRQFTADMERALENELKNSVYEDFAELFELDDNLVYTGMAANFNLPKSDKQEYNFEKFDEFSPSDIQNAFLRSENNEDGNHATSVKDWKRLLSALNCCSQKGLTERFDSTIGAGTVLMPFGGLYQTSPSQVMASKLPVMCGETETVTLMANGFSPFISAADPYKGALLAVVESVSKIVANGGKFDKVRLTFQEYFERLGDDPKRWGKPFAALLGALKAQLELGIPAIGGKDSMSGSFEEFDVPPTLVSFALGVTKVKNVVGSAFHTVRSTVIYERPEYDENGLPDFKSLKAIFRRVEELISSGRAKTVWAVGAGGIAEGIAKMCFGNRIGFIFVAGDNVFEAAFGSFIIELKGGASIGERVLGYTSLEYGIKMGDYFVSLRELQKNWEITLEPIFPAILELESTNMRRKTDAVHVPQEFCDPSGNPRKIWYKAKKRTNCKQSIAKPKVLIPVFPGTNCEYDTIRAFEKAGATPQTIVIRNLSPEDVTQSVEAVAAALKNSQILMLPGGFSGGDEPDGSAKFIAAFFRNPLLTERIRELLNVRDGLILGICNGFQALIKLGLVPCGDIVPIDSNSPTLTYNTISRHQSTYVRTRVASNKSPWLSLSEAGDIHSVPVSHGEGRFIAPSDVIRSLEANGQIATQYIDANGTPTYDIRYNPNGSYVAIEGITSPDGRVFGKMAHSERYSLGVAKNICGEKNQRIFLAGVRYFN